MKSSGTREEYSERDKLLDEAIELVCDSSIKGGTEKDIGKFYRNESLVSEKRQRDLEPLIQPKRKKNVADIFKSMDFVDLVIIFINIGANQSKRKEVRLRERKIFG